MDAAVPKSNPPIGSIEQSMNGLESPSYGRAISHSGSFHGRVPPLLRTDVKAFQALDPLGQAALTKDLLALIATLNVATDGSMNVPSAHAEFVITKV